MNSNVAHALAPMTALDEQARPITLGTFWATRPSVITFIRHFG
jgi:hypothetical protein